VKRGSVSPAEPQFGCDSRGVAKIFHVNAIHDNPSCPPKDNKRVCLNASEGADWGNLVSSSFEPPRRKISQSGKLIYDFVLNRDPALRENVQEVARKMVGTEDEVRRPALLEHPMAKGRGRLAFRVELPPGDKGECLLSFEALLNHPKSSGAAFRVEVEGWEMFAKTLGGGEQYPAEISLN
jgi:hypothetical protein